MKTPRSASAAAIAQPTAHVRRGSGTANAPRARVNTNTLSSDRLRSMMYPARYSPPGPGPSATPKTNAKPSPAAVQTAVTAAAPRIVRGRSTARSSASRATAPAMSAGDCHESSNRISFGSLNDSEGLTRLGGRRTGLEGRPDGDCRCWATPLLAATLAVIETPRAAGPTRSKSRADGRNCVR